jgi:uncharacterized protein (TIGR02145 family)
MAENLKTTKYKDGTAIPLVTDNKTWCNLSTPGYCWFNNDATTYKNAYGALYNWYTVSTVKLCPTGWHVPTDYEWMILISNLGGLDIAGGNLKETGTMHWTSPNTGATNKSGFLALPGGLRHLDYGGTFGGIGYTSNWWSATEYMATHAWLFALYYKDANVTRGFSNKIFGCSIRCIKD